MLRPRVSAKRSRTLRVSSRSRTWEALRRNRSAHSSDGRTADVSWAGTLPSPDCCPPDRETATVTSARVATVAAMGTGFMIPPSASSRPLSMTGVMMLGRAIDARTATSTGPSWNQTSLRASRSVATAVKGMGRSSMSRPASSSRTFAMIFSARITPGAEGDGSSSRSTSRWLRPSTHCAYASSCPAAWRPPTSAPIELPATVTMS